MFFFRRRKRTKKSSVRGLPTVKYLESVYNERLRKHGTKYLPVAARYLAAVPGPATRKRSTMSL